MNEGGKVNNLALGKGGQRGLEAKQKCTHLKVNKVLS